MKKAQDISFKIIAYEKKIKICTHKLGEKLCRYNNQTRWQIKLKLI